MNSQPEVKTVARRSLGQNGTGEPGVSAPLRPWTQTGPEIVQALGGRAGEGLTTAEARRRLSRP